MKWVQGVPVKTWATFSAFDLRGGWSAFTGPRVSVKTLTSKLATGELINDFLAEFSSVRASG